VINGPRDSTHRTLSVEKAVGSQFPQLVGNREISHVLHSQLVLGREHQLHETFPHTRSTSQIDVEFPISLLADELSFFTYI
jgi:hypothetical protein